MFGAQFGNGVLFADGRPAGFFNVTGGSFGLQAGAQNFSQAYFFTTPEALATFRRTRGFELGPASTSPSPTSVPRARSAPRPCRSR